VKASHQGVASARCINRVSTWIHKLEEEGFRPLPTPILWGGRLFHVLHTAAVVSC
jgi:hypothetical protein